MKIWTVQEWCDHCQFERAVSYHRLDAINALRPRWRRLRPLVYRRWRQEQEWASEVRRRNERAEERALVALMIAGPGAVFKLDVDEQPDWLIMTEHCHTYWLARDRGLWR